MKMFNALVAVAALSSGVAMASDHGKAPNCEIKGKKSHVKDEAACTKKKGTWSVEAAAAPAAAPATTPVEAAPATAPAK